MGRIKIYFKWQYKQYYSQYHQGNLLLWCGCTKTGKTFYLGCFKDNNIEISATLHKKDWDIQHGARRFSKVIYDKYWDKKYTNIKTLDLQGVAKKIIIHPWQLN